MAAGMHHRHLGTVPLRLGLRGEGELDFLGHRQRIHVGAQRDHRAVPSASTQSADHAGDGDTLAHRIAQPLQMCRDDTGGAGLLVAELGMLVEVAPPFDHPRFDGPRGVVQLAVQWQNRSGGGLDASAG